MSDTYEEQIAGEVLVRLAPTDEHERLVSRLHALVAGSLSPNSVLQLLPPRSGLQLTDADKLRPDLTVVRLPPARESERTPQLYLVAEVLLAGDHHLDTVVKKQIWSDLRLPRLWMVDPRYLNVEIYGCGEYGFTLLDILANRGRLTDPFLPGLACSMDELFAEA
jgi:Uma2 family endonuclease